ncbi:MULTISPECIES: hypothetical protein [unclassified Bradyrhizobium]|uniref:hypothetical protein n=1 Tax=unclassified Bradyrhizobium TaxID=2631580 RepID=UPI0028EAB48B|nr:MULTISPECIES: hypothetical protein [unclassified Bradyrhizobium]
MTEKNRAGGIGSFAGGTMMVYGVAIGNALAAAAKGPASIDDLVSLRDHAHQIVGVQGDLVAALTALDAEIAKRGGAKAAPAPEMERFVAQIDGGPLSGQLKSEIEQAIQKAVTAEIAKLDTRGDMVATPLSQIKAFGAGPGSQIYGAVYRPKLDNP